MQPIYNISKANQILNKVCEYSKYSEDQIKSRSRISGIVVFRYIAAYLILKNTNLSLGEVGKILSRDYTTILYARDKVKKLMDVHDLKMEEPFTQISAML